MIDEILHIRAWFAQGTGFGGDDAEIRAFQRLSGELSEITADLGDLRYDADAEDGGMALADPGLPDRVTGFFASHREAFPNEDLVKIVSGGRWLRDGAGNRVWPHRLLYRWDDPNHLDFAMIEWPIVLADTPDAGSTVPDIVAALTAWRPAALVTAWPSALRMAGRVFPGSQSSGLAIWLPGTLPPTTLDAVTEAAHRVEALNGGTLIQTSPTFFTLADNAALERFQTVDRHLMEAALLPEMTDFFAPF